MADLVTHLCSVMLPGVFVRHRALPLVGVGSVLPDAVSRLPGEALEAIHAAGWRMPDFAVQPWGVTHEPIPLALVCLLASQAFRRADRAQAFAALALGCAAHLGLDLLQDHHGQGYHLLFPLSLWQGELGWLPSEATVTWAPWLAGITALAWGIRRYRDRVASGNFPPSTPGPVP